MALKDKTCVPCEGGAPPLQGKELQEYLSQLQDGWEMEDGKKIRREFKKKDFSSALAFVNKIGELAEREGHHPDITLHGYNKVGIELSTHAISGLSENDFILAAKIEELS